MSDFVRLPSGPPRRGRGGGGRGRHWNNRARGRGRGRGGRGRGGGRRQRQENRDFTDEIEELGTRSDDTLCVAVQGCCHGELDAIYDRLKRHEETTGQKVDLLLCCGDFQSLRSGADYHSLAVPPKYRTLGSFHRYYSGEKVAPILTIFVGGNHEASQPLQELYYGGWVAPNIYYLGAAGVVNVAGVRIGGVSGIYKSHDYTQGRFERPPYDRSSLRSVYHVRNTDVYRLKCLSPENRVDVMLSHDWPQGIEQHGDTDKLLRQKPFFRDEVQRNDLGSPPSRELLDALKPKWWFSGHLHVKFKAQVNHAPARAEAARGNSSMASLVPSQVSRTSTEHAAAVEVTGSAVNGNEPAGETHQDESAETTHFQSLESSKACNEPDLTDMMTQFLALDKCLPRRNHLSIVHVPCQGRKDVIEYDPEWLAVLQKTHHLTCAERRRVHCPRESVHINEEEVESMRTRLVERGQHNATPLAIPQNFSRTVPPPSSGRGNVGPIPMMGNPQTDDLLNFLGLEHVITIPYNNGSPNVAIPGSVPFQQDENEIDLEEDEEGDAIDQRSAIILDYVGTPSKPAQATVIGDNEIDLDGEVDDNEIDLDDDDDDQSDTDPQVSNGDIDASPACKKARANS